MKPEWITDNVQRAYQSKQGDSWDYHWDKHLREMSLEEALDLLHWCAVRVNLEYDYGGGFFRGRKDNYVLVSKNICDIVDDQIHVNGESLLHAVLFAIDAITATNPEAFK